MQMIQDALTSKKASILLNKLESITIPEVPTAYPMANLIEHFRSLLEPIDSLHKALTEYRDYRKQEGKWKDDSSSKKLLEPVIEATEQCSDAKNWYGNDNPIDQSQSLNVKNVYKLIRTLYYALWDVVNDKTFKSKISVLSNTKVHRRLKALQTELWPHVQYFLEKNDKLNEHKGIKLSEKLKDINFNFSGHDIPNKFEFELEQFYEGISDYIAENRSYNHKKLKDFQSILEKHKGKCKDEDAVKEAVAEILSFMEKNFIFKKLTSLGLNSKHGTDLLRAEWTRIGNSLLKYQRENTENDFNRKKKEANKTDFNRKKKEAGVYKLVRR